MTMVTMPASARCEASDTIAAQQGGLAVQIGCGRQAPDLPFAEVRFMSLPVITPYRASFTLPMRTTPVCFPRGLGRGTEMFDIAGGIIIALSAIGMLKVGGHLLTTDEPVDGATRFWGFFLAAVSLAFMYWLLIGRFTTWDDYVGLFNSVFNRKR